MDLACWLTTTFKIKSTFKSSFSVSPVLLVSSLSLSLSSTIAVSLDNSVDLLIPAIMALVEMVFEDVVTPLLLFLL